MKILRTNIFSLYFSSLTWIHLHLLHMLTFSGVVLSVCSLTHEHSHILTVINRLSLGLAAPLCQKIPCLYIFAYNASFWREPTFLSRVGIHWCHVTVKFPWACNKASDGLPFTILFLDIRSLLLYSKRWGKKYSFPELTADQQYEVPKLDR